MPKMKYFQTIADMRNIYEDRLEMLQRAESNPYVLEAYELSSNDAPILERKIKALRYLIACQHGHSFNGSIITQPDYTDFEEVFTEQRDDMSKRIESLRDAAQPQMKSVRKMYEKRHKCAEYYLEQLKNPGYLEKLPEVIVPN